MNCLCCQNTEGAFTKYPFDLVETLYKNVYAGQEVFTHKCKACNALYIGLGLETLKGTHTYWAEISYPEVQTLVKIKGLPEIIDLTTQLIQEKSSHIYCNHQGKFFYKSEAAVI